MRQSHSKIMTSFVYAGLFGACLALASAMSPAQAQGTAGTPGSPSATTTIDGQQLPAPDPKFGGVIKDDALQSTPCTDNVRSWHKSDPDRATGDVGLEAETRRGPVALRRPF
jgi:hypothetical protein